MRLLIPALIAVVLIPAQVPPGTSLNSRLLWDCVTTDTLGNPETIAEYEVALFPPGADGNTVPLRTAMTPADPCAYTLRDLVTGVTDGQYDLRVRAYDDAGNVSLWSPPFTIDLDAAPPSHPTNLRF